MEEAVAGDHAEDTAAALVLTLDADPTLGYASIQNDIPVVRSLRVHNATAKSHVNVVVTVSCIPAFAEGARIRFASLVPGETREISPVDLKADHDYLRQLNEAERATIRVCATVDDEVLANTSVDVLVLAYDQWAGTRGLVELISAFVMPNDLAVDVLLGKASQLLRRADSALSMDGYQSKHRDNVWKQVSAFYSTIAAENLQYAEPPSSFTSDGQKVRTPDRIVAGRVATCLDLALLFASCLEQAGLRPVLVFKEGHAFVACWLIPTNFPLAVVDDVQAIRKRVLSGELLVFECTGVAASQRVSLRNAVGRAREYRFFSLASG